jgi:signal transduction histidine kinase
MNQTTPHNQTPLAAGVANREQAVRGTLGLVDEMGLAAERFFGRLYRGLGRKNTQNAPNPGPDRLALLEQANRELSARVVASQTLAFRLEAVFARIDEGVIMQSPEGRIVLINDAALKLLGGIKSFWESDLGKLFRAAQNQPARTTGAEFEEVGEAIRVQVNDRILGGRLAAVFNTDRTPLGTLIILRDVTREALADRLKDQFVTQITHELRTPLTSIKGMSDVLLNSPADKPPNRKFLEAIARNTAILDRMIIELLDLSEITTGTFMVRQNPLALDQLIYDLLNGREAALNKAGLQIGLLVANTASLNILGDSPRLLWAIGHIIDNAINYTQRNGQISIRAGRIKNDHVLIEVIDTGVGISEYDQSHMFERFYRGTALTPEGKTIDPRGLGQGLFIARAVAEAHKGYLVATSVVGTGSRFTLGLPLKPASTPATAGTPSAGQTS